MPNPNDFQSRVRKNNIEERYDMVATIRLIVDISIVFKLWLNDHIVVFLPIM